MGRSNNVAPRKLPRQERSMVTVDAIFEAASQVFSENGYDVTTDKIAERAGVSIGTLYQYFPNKDSILFGLWKRHVVEAEAIVDSFMEDFLLNHEKDASMTRILVEYMIALHLDNPGQHRLFSDEMPRPASIIEHIKAFEDKCSRFLESLIKSSNNTRLKNLPVSARIIYHTLEGLVHHYILYDSESMDQEEFAEELCDMIYLQLAQRKYIEFFILMFEERNSIIS